MLLRIVPRSLAFDCKNHSGGLARFSECAIGTVLHLFFHSCLEAADSDGSADFCQVGFVARDASVRGRCVGFVEWMPEFGFACHFEWKAFE